MTDKIIVGVHGMGDQVQYETTQTIANQFRRYYKVQTAIPLGHFHSSNIEINGIVKVPSGNDTLYFTEAYWANIARKPETEGYVLEETKHWVRTTVEGLRDKVKCKSSNTTQASKGWFVEAVRKIGNGIDKGVSKAVWQDNDDLSLPGKGSNVRVDYRMIKSVLYEAIDTIAVMEKLFRVTKMAGLFEFNLNRILTDFMGDVQIMTEFEKQRTEILNKFVSTVDRVYGLNKYADIYIIAHSEGTVVSFLGLLKAIQQNCPWVANVKGFMTLGSPIDKHMTLWPDLWEKYAKLPCNNTNKGRIKWQNYYDYGDPVGYDLDVARNWVRENAEMFCFGQDTDHGFSRYCLPGAAHVKYWEDDVVFDHFIKSVVETPDPKTQKKPEPPSTKKRAWLVSNFLPYICIFALLFISVYFICKPIHNCKSIHTSSDSNNIKDLGKSISTSSGSNYSNNFLLLLRSVGGMAAIISGMTVMARIPRHTKRIRWYVGAVIIFALCASASYFLLGKDVRRDINASFFGINYLTVAATISVIVAFIGNKFPTARTKPLVVLGGTAIIWSVFQLTILRGYDNAIWPILIGGAIFLYGWWLSVLLFDLAFIWHRYIRSSQALILLKDIHNTPKPQPSPPKKEVPKGL